MNKRQYKKFRRKYYCKTYRKRDIEYMDEVNRRFDIFTYGYPQHLWTTPASVIRYREWVQKFKKYNK